MCWISVNDQLPEEGAEVDGWAVDKNCVQRRICNAVFLKGEFCYVGSAYTIPYEKVTGEKFTHWRYPPAPPHGATA